MSLTKIVNKIADAVKDVYDKIYAENKIVAAFLSPVAVSVSAISALFNGVEQYQDSVEEYENEGLSTKDAIKDAALDALAVTIHETSSTYLQTTDNIGLQIATDFISSVTGEDIAEQNYAAELAEKLKTFNADNSGSNDNDTITNETDGSLVNGGAGNDYMRNFASNSTIMGWSGDDTIFSGENISGNSILGGTGNDVIVAYDTNSTIHGDNESYDGDDADDEIISYGDANKIFGNAGNDIIIISADNNTVNGGAGDDILFLEGSDNAIIEYSDGDGNDTVYGYDGGDKFKISGDYQTSTSAQDVTIKIGEGSIILKESAEKYLTFVSDGTDYDNLIVGTSTRDLFRYGGGSNDFVNNFVTGMADNSDAVVLYNGFSKAYRDGYEVYFEMTDGKKIQLHTDTNSGDDAILYAGNDSDLYVAKIADSSATNITYYDGIDYYGLAQFGTLNLQNGTHDANSHDIRLDGSNGISYLYIANVNAAGSSGNDYLAGNSGNNSIIAGSGETTLWGGNGGDDTLVGGSAKDYFRFTGEGNDVVVDFTSGMANNSDAAILPENFTVSRSNNILTFSAPNGYTMTVNTDSYSGDDAILYSGDGQSFYSAKIADSTATNITYYENIKYYGLAQFGTLNLQNGTHDGNSHDIRLDGSNGVSYLYIANINASGSSGNDTLYGNAGSNEIRAGSGNSTLWGGQYDGTADILIGGDGVDMFLVGKSDGNDEIQNSSYNDVINLYDVSLSEISTSVDENNIYLSLNNGSRITIQNSDNLSSVVWTSDGGQYRYNRSTGWQSA